MTLLEIIEVNSTKEFLIGLLMIVVVIAGLSIAFGGVGRAQFGKAMTKGGIVVLGLIIAGIGALGGTALINLGQDGAEQIGINTSAGE